MSLQTQGPVASNMSGVNNKNQSNNISQTMIKTKNSNVNNIKEEQKAKCLLSGQKSQAPLQSKEENIINQTLSSKAAEDKTQRENQMESKCMSLIPGGGFIQYLVKQVAFCCHNPQQLPNSQQTIPNHFLSNQKENLKHPMQSYQELSAKEKNSQNSLKTQMNPSQQKAKRSLGNAMHQDQSSVQTQNQQRVVHKQNMQQKASSQKNTVYETHLGKSQQNLEDSSKTSQQQTQSTQKQVAEAIDQQMRTQQSDIFMQQKDLLDQKLFKPIESLASGDHFFILTYQQYQQNQELQDKNKQLDNYQEYQNIQQEISEDDSSFKKEVEQIFPTQNENQQEENSFKKEGNSVNKTVTSDNKSSGFQSPKLFNSQLQGNQTSSRQSPLKAKQQSPNQTQQNLMENNQIQSQNKFQTQMSSSLGLGNSFAKNVNFVQNPLLAKKTQSEKVGSTFPQASQSSTQPKNLSSESTVEIKNPFQFGQISITGQQNQQPQYQNPFFVPRPQNNAPLAQQTSTNLGIENKQNVASFHQRSKSKSAIEQTSQLIQEQQNTQSFQSDFNVFASQKNLQQEQNLSKEQNPFKVQFYYIDHNKSVLTLLFQESSHNDQ